MHWAYVFEKLTIVPESESITYDIMRYNLVFYVAYKKLLNTCRLGYSVNWPSQKDPVEKRPLEKGRLKKL